MYEQIIKTIEENRLAEALEQVKKIPDDKWEKYNFLGLILLYQQNFSASKEAFEKALEKEPVNDDLLFNYAQTLLALGYEREAKKSLESIENKDWNIYDILGDIEDRLENDIYAVSFYEKAYELNKSFDIKKKIDLKRKIISSDLHKNQIEIASKKNISPLKVMIIDVSVNEKTHDLARKITTKGFSVDLAYAGKNPIRTLNPSNNPYAKILGLTNIEGMICYIKHYHYDIIFISKASDLIKSKIKEAGLIYIEDLTGFSHIQQNRNNHQTSDKKVNKQSVDNLSVIIPTFNRPKYLHKCLASFLSFGYLKPNIFILDSSEKQKMIENQEILKDFESDRIIYKTYPRTIDFFSKLSNVMDRITTDFLALCADDDFLAEEGLNESLKILEEDSSLFSVKGKNLYFTYSRNHLVEYDWFFGLEEEDFVQRLIKVTQGFVPTLMYQVFRKDGFKKIIKFIATNEKKIPKNFTFKEYMFYFMVIMTGKIRQIYLDLNIRDKSVPREEELKNFPHALKDRNFNDNYYQMYKSLMEYSEMINEDFLKLKSQFPLIFSDFLKNFLNVPKSCIRLEENGFNMDLLEKGMRNSWVWPKGL